MFPFLLQVDEEYVRGNEVTEQPALVPAPAGVSPARESQAGTVAQLWHTEPCAPSAWEHPPGSLTGAASVREHTKANSNFTSCRVIKSPFFGLLALTLCSQAML